MKETDIRKSMIDYLETRSPKGEIQRGKAVMCTDRKGGPVPFGTVGKVTKVESDGQFLKVEWVGKNPATGRAWHTSDKDTTSDYVHLFQPQFFYDLNRLSLAELGNMVETMAHVTGDHARQAGKSSQTTQRGRRR